MSPRRLFTVTAIAEAISWTLLIAGMVLRAVGVTEAGVSIGGAVHGFVFLAYVVVTVFVGRNQRWPWRTMLLALVAAIPPWATIPVDWWLGRKGRLDGGWDTSTTSWEGRARAAVVGRPLLAVAVVLAAVAAVFVMLLILGPPGA